MVIICYEDDFISVTESDHRSLDSDRKSVEDVGCNDFNL